MNNNIFAVCDSDETYAFRLAEFMMEKLKISSRFHIFTKSTELEAFLLEEKVEILLIAESIYREIQDSLANQVGNIILLQETDIGKKLECKYVNKYQNPEDIIRFVVDETDTLSQMADVGYESETGQKIIGIYSPIKRCLQTTFALTLGQMLAKSHKVLYMNFEYYSGFSRMMGKEYTKDMMDAVYYYVCAKDKLTLQIPMMIQNLNGMDYLPPMKSYRGLQELSGNQWVEFIRTMGKIGGYDYIILDLDDGIKDVFDVLMQCCKIYTIVKEDPIAAAKMAQYEQMLQLYEMENIAEKTTKCKFPYFERLPNDMELMTHGDLAHYVQEIIKEDLDENI